MAENAKFLGVEMSSEENKMIIQHINTIRFLAADAVQKANSGHPGMPMGCAPIAYLLFGKVMRHNPANPKWINRDRFVLSAGHGSMLLYAALHLSGYNVTLNDIKNFRQWGSITPGHPEYGLTPGVETTTGPLGQGFANAVGMALAKEYLASVFNKDDFHLIDHHIYGIVSDGDLMEGITHEAASFAGHNKLGSIILFYDNNKITIDGSLSLAMSEDVGKRFEAYGWHVTYVDDVNDTIRLAQAVTEAQASGLPSLIVTNTVIGFGSPNKQGKSSSHGSPLGVEEIRLAKKNLGWEFEQDFHIPTETAEFFAQIKIEGEREEEEWNELLSSYREKYVEEAELWDKFFNSTDSDWENSIPHFSNYGEKMATRSSSGKVLNAIAPAIQNLIGGAADLAPSNNTEIKGFENFSALSRSGRNIRFGIREHAMASIMNGMAMYGGVIPYGATFLVFSDYLRPAIRIAALSHVRTILVFTHDSIGLGEDGPTHQPVEHLAALRAIPGCVVLRPCDANETAEAWKFAIKHHSGPVMLSLTRQDVTILDRDQYASAGNLEKGAYVLKDFGGEPEIILMASGSEVEIAIEAAEALLNDGINSRVVSFPSMELFDRQDNAYKETVLPSNINKRIAVEAGVSQPWYKYCGIEGGYVTVDKFGASAPSDVLYQQYGITSGSIILNTKRMLSK